MSSERVGYNYGEQLDAIAELLTKHHLIGQVKAIGRMECVEALRQLLDTATPPQPLQSGQQVWVEAVVGWLSPDGVNAIVTSLENGGDITAGATLVVNVADIHPAPVNQRRREKRHEN